MRNISFAAIKRALSDITPFSDRNLVRIGIIGSLVIIAVTALAVENQKLPFLHGQEYSGYFADAGGLFTGASVEISGFAVGKVSSIELEGSCVLVKFTVNGNVRLGERTSAAIKTRSLLGTKNLDITPAGEGHLAGPIPLERTESPFQLPDALGDLSRKVGEVNTAQLSDSLATLAQTFSGTAPDLRNAVQGVARFAQVVDERDTQLRDLLDNASKATGVLAKRSDQVVELVKNTNALLAQLRTQSAALDHLTTNIAAVAQQLKGFIAENREQLRPALDKLNGVLTILDNRKDKIQQSVKMWGDYLLSLGETIASGPFFKAYVSNLLPGQFLQPFISAAFSDLGVDPATLLPSQLTDPEVGQPGTPPLPPPFPRTGQGGQPRLKLPDAITGNPADPRYPPRDELPAPPPGGPPPGPPARPAVPTLPGGAGDGGHIYVPAPGEAPGAGHPGDRP